VASHPFYEIYLDDVLLLSCCRYDPREGAFGLLVEEGTGVFTHLEARELTTS
jgi:hypothetical protein